MPFICQRKFIITSWNGWICETAAHNGQNNKQNLFRERVCVCGVVGSVSPFVQSTSTEREIEGINMHCPDSGASHINRNQFINEMIYEPCILVTLHLCGYLLHVVLLFCFSFYCTYIAHWLPHEDYPRETVLCKCMYAFHSVSNVFFGI